MERFRKKKEDFIGSMAPYYYEKEACAMCEKLKDTNEIFVGYCEAGDNSCYFKHKNEEFKSKYFITVNSTDNHNLTGWAGKRFGSWSGGSLGSIEGVDCLKESIIILMEGWIKNHTCNAFHEMTEKNLCCYSSVPGITKDWVLREYNKLRLHIHPPDKVECEDGSDWYYKKPISLNKFI